jgi:hypothetical protein
MTGQHIAVAARVTNSHAPDTYQPFSTQQHKKYPQEIVRVSIKTLVLSQVYNASGDIYCPEHDGLVSCQGLNFYIQCQVRICNN